jgi:prepilin-type N-terminal cleavage/methylation domain-containing protein
MTLDFSARRRSQAAFTLIEILTAVGIVGIVSVTLYAGLAASFNAVENSRLELRATQILTEKLEAMRLFNWDQVTASSFIPTNFTEKYQPLESDSVVYSGTVWITNAPVQNAYAGTMRKVVAQVTWVNGNGSREKRMETLISQYGIQNYLY